MNLRIELDMRDGFIYVREKVGRSWKPKFRGTSADHVFKTLSIMYGEGNAANKEKSDGPTTNSEPLETIQS